MYEKELAPALITAESEEAESNPLCVPAVKWAGASPTQNGLTEEERRYEHH
jgi:hypothetical protein